MGLVVDGPEESVVEESVERLPEITADWLIVGVGGDMEAAIFDEIRSSALYQSIPAVQAGREVIVDGTLWSGLGHLWARSIVDDLEARFF
jgi:iron complex transport system substrate-binding protein